MYSNQEDKYTGIAYKYVAMFAKSKYEQLTV